MADYSDPVRRQPQTRKRYFQFSLTRLFVGVALFSTVLALFVVDLRPYYLYQSAHARLRAAVHLGMDIDEAVAVLRAQGFSPQPKYFPTANKDYYWVDIPLARRTPFAVFVSRRAGYKVQFYHYGCLEAG
jgi:hypothetical protein